MDGEVLDDADIAALMEENERDASIRRILSNKPRERNIEALLNPNLCCESCDTPIPIERQRIVLTINKECSMCVDCQQDYDKQERAYV